MSQPTAEQVVLLDDAGRPCGTAAKTGVHTEGTPLHLGFSCHVVDTRGRVLITRRSLSKATWPGVWTNAFCGHPRPDEPLEQAVRRRASHELGLELDDVAEVLPDFRYRATDASGVVEHEVCPVFVAAVRGEPCPNPDEVAEVARTRPQLLRRAAEAAPWAFSPWLVEQIPLLKLYRGHGGDLDPTEERMP